MSDAKKFTKEQADKMLFHVSSLDQTQRDTMKEHLHRLLDHGGGTLYKQSFHLELLKMQHAGELSEIDVHSVEKALFG